MVGGQHSTKGGSVREVAIHHSRTTCLKQALSRAVGRLIPAPGLLLLSDNVLGHGTQFLLPQFPTCNLQLMTGIAAQICREAHCGKEPVAMEDNTGKVGHCS